MAQLANTFQSQASSAAGLVRSRVMRLARRPWHLAVPACIIFSLPAPSGIKALSGGLDSMSAQSATGDIERGRVLGPDETIAGRAVGERSVFLLTENRSLIEITWPGGRYTRLTVQGAGPDDEPWGLARLSSGELWTLLNRNTLGRLSPEGRVGRRLELDRPHVGLFALGRQLLYQAFDSRSGPTVEIGPPGNDSRRLLGDLRPRSVGFALPHALLAGLVMCGPAAHADVPCWFPGEIVLHLIDTLGGIRVAQLTHLQPGDTPSANLEEHPGPILDAYSSSQTIWILATQENSSRGADGWRVLKYDQEGRLLKSRPLGLPARLILSGTEHAIHLLMRSGLVEEINVD